MLDYVPLGVIVLDRSAKPLHINGPAADILARRDGLILRSGSLTAVARADAQRLAQVFSRLEPTVVAVARNPRGRPYPVMVNALQPSPRVSGTVVLVHDPEAHGSPPPGVLAELYGLTQAESAVVASLASGLGPKDHAERHGISIHTVRFHLKSVFAKTGVNSQAQLVAELARATGALFARDLGFAAGGTNRMPAQTSGAGFAALPQTRSRSG